MTTLLSEVRRMLEHGAWADDLLFGALRTRPEPPAEIVRELNHIIGADEIWLSRIEGRVPRVEVWPALPLAELEALAARVHAGFARITDPEPDLDRGVAYTNSAGQSFVTPLKDILIHVALHAQYHRGKLNLLLRQGDQEPVPADYIGYVRGVPAAVTPVRRDPA